METSRVADPRAVFRTPQWVQEAVFYQIFPDRFAASATLAKPGNLEPWESPPTTHGFKGGDLIGIVEHLDYLQDLGVTAIYLNPVFRSTANHRYHTHDYYVVDPILGGNEALDALIAQAHRRNMRIVLDGVFNHTGRGFYQFNSILENGYESPYIDWFHVYSWPLYPYGPSNLDAGYQSWWGIRDLPKFNADNREVREFLLDVGTYWIERGVDGWRLDVPNEIDDDGFWREFRTRVKAANEDAYIVGEIWGEADRWLAGDQFDAVMNYPFTRACLGFFASADLTAELAASTGLNHIEPLDAPAFGAIVDELVHRYPWSATLAQLNLLGSHDTPRYLTLAHGDDSALKLATLFQMTYPGAPCIYYGDEIGMQGGRDPENRGGLPWDESVWNRSMRDYFKRCVALRHSRPVFRSGRFLPLYARNQVYIFERQLDRDVAIVALNAGTRDETVDLAFPSSQELVYTESAFGDNVPDLVGGVLRGWHLPPRSGAVLLGHVAAV
jgi:cyclomaltodextrinase / maltogenic alpha-amylase / neopullulanase